MKALSFWQPHGSLLVTGAKPFETRGRATNVRGTILIHASQRCVRREMQYYLQYVRYQQGLAPLITGAKIGDIADVIISDLAFGAFIGIGDLIGCHKTEEMTKAQLVRSSLFGNFEPGRFAWEFAHVKRFKKPIPAKGHQGFFYASLPTGALDAENLIEVESA